VTWVWHEHSLWQHEMHQLTIRADGESLPAANLAKMSEKNLN